tara:strand:- start:148 stop:552 length:405 start_codon:yes stop_codon:yes gene_type:complete
MSGVITAAIVGGGAYLATAGTALAIGAGTAAAVGIGAGAMKNQYDQGKKAQASQERGLVMQQNAQTEAVKQANAQAQTSQQAVNRANQQSPDTASIMSEAGQAAKGGGAGTMLTGPMGVDPNQLALGKNTLLGG